MVYKLLKDGFAEGKDLNCSETLLYAANEAYDLGLDKNGLILSAAFGGGMGIGDKCGAITGALMVLSNLYVKDRAHESDKIKALSIELFAKYEEAMKSIDCKPLKEMYKTEEKGCSDIILKAAQILDEIVAREGLEK